MAILTTPLWSATLTAPTEHITLFADALGEDAVSISVTAPPRQKMAELQAIFDFAPDAATLNTRLAIMAAMQNTKAPTLKIRAIPQLDWLKKVATDFPPLPVARWIVFGAHEKPKALYPRHKLLIDATSAFGTGEHPTTRGCLMMLDRILKKTKPRRMLDMGCGTGILAMGFAAATKGIAVGIDLDAPSVVIARDNARQNGMAAHVRVALGNGYRAQLAKRHAPYDLIMANIFAKPLAHMAKDLKAHLRPGGIAILAGLLNTQANMVIAAHNAQGLALIHRLVIGEWTILALQRPIRAI